MLDMRSHGIFISGTGAYQGADVTSVNPDSQNFYLPVTDIFGVSDLRSERRSIANSWSKNDGEKDPIIV
jgi:hypothetical protein